MKRGMELWGGLECTVNRVGERFHDQFEKGGHKDRPEDLDLVAELGIRTLRYPVLWERTAPERPDARDWRFADERLARLREHGVAPIAGLVHHGSGPRYTDLLDDGFAPGLAEHARAVAERYPWIDAYTPVNEPLTTARFSALYGHWYPHATDARSFAKALLNQVKAVVLSMEAVRKTNPQARLVQTDDLGKTHATSPLRYQAEFDNERRWLTWDLLCGKVDRDHPMWRYFVREGVDERDLGWHLEHPCPPDVVGVNYYLTSERFLDHRLDRYPDETHGENGRDLFADVEAVRVLAGGVDGPSTLLREAWERYGLPLAITECHLGCTREEQVRWLRYVWDEAEEARREGADVRAVAVWSLFGAHDWCSLLTCDANRYEPGVFDLRAPAPRPTALVDAVKTLARGDALQPMGDGWWERPVRLLYPPTLTPGGAKPSPAKRPRGIRRPLMIVGEGDGLASTLARACDLRDFDVVRVAKRDLGSAAEACRALDLHRPWTVVVLEAPGALPAGDLAAACGAIDARLVVFSDESVFDGRKGSPYLESDEPRPGDLFGASRVQFEAEALRVLPEAMVVRAGTPFGREAGDCFLKRTLRALERGAPLRASRDVLVSPTFVPDLVDAALDLLVDGTRGVVHLTSAAAATPVEFARRIAQGGGYDERLVVEVPFAHLNPKVARPRAAGLASERLWTMPSLDDAIRRALSRLRTADAVEAATYLA